MKRNNEKRLTRKNWTKLYIHYWYIKALSIYEAASSVVKKVTLHSFVLF